MTNVLLAGGGTAGHVNPLIAVGKKLAGENLFALATPGGLEHELLPQAGIPLFQIPKVPAPRRPNMDAVRFPRQFVAAVSTVEKLIVEKRINVVVGFGGFVATPAYLAAKKVGVPIVIHEQNVRPGLANKLGARWAKAIALTFADTKLAARQGITEVTGLPLRPEIEELATAVDRAQRQQRARAMFDLDPQLPVLLVTGGSLGAQKINEAVVDSLGAVRGFQILHLAGKGKVTVSSTSTYKVREYCLNMEDAFAAADLVLSRSGAGSVSEITALCLPAVYVPLAIGNGEQKLNAAAVVKAGGAYMVPNDKFDIKTLRDIVFPLVVNPQKLSDMSTRTRVLARPDAAVRVANLVRQVANFKAPEPFER
ncbi:MAG: UDP-N-acetylglucosamine--N-acetylmuramyl-(pentapeptide) pyrophosphoryl-undecaprenol N-acetylglucosamine transferase [Actinomycetaceae bacterium]|nr:UDP-N-acetylglucosamine--N-acetylmuramyl-(pentapeptide) pyrophosphoryl-undecaprenol N-acetylglucosamine transferase [Actinomycetaceae bacterium]